ncbi:MAG: MBL fold metallo-hydrolase [Candidatus Staskawiczbacteria bacterium]|jgi:competence protein ComEC
MDKKIILFIAGILLILNFVCWREIFVLARDANLKISFLDVGQGDSAFIETPQNHQILIDGGPGQAVLEKLANNMPVWDKTIDLVILSHPESDHMRGLLSVLKIYKIDYILWTGVVRQNAEYNIWLNELEKQKEMGAKIIIAQSGQEIRAGNVLIKTLYPFNSIEGQEPKKTSNDAGVVSKVIFGANAFLFTGDISSKGEYALVKSKEDILSDVLKVAHHGSKYSTSNIFLENVNPKIAVIEVGKNSYGHPTPETLQRLENFGIKIFTTYKDGDIKFVSNGKNITLEK